MIVHILPFLNSLRIVLASASPRRLQLLRTLGLTSLTVLPSTFPETLPHAEHTPASYVATTARAKAVEVYERCSGQCDLLIAADTIVVSEEGVIVEKPRDAADAVRMLAALSGRTHTVITAVVLVKPAARLAAQPHVTAAATTAIEQPVVDCFTERTAVTFASLSAAMIDAYVATGEPLDKAGAYGIQAMGGQFVQSIAGDYNNVVGLPLHALCRHLLDFTESLRVTAGGEDERGGATADAAE